MKDFSSIRGSKVCMVGLGVGQVDGALIGGHVNNIINLSNALSDDGFEVHILTTPPIHTARNGYQIEQYQMYGNIKIHTVNVMADFSSPKSMFAFSAFAGLINKFRKLDKDENFDVIHGHSGFPSVALVTKFCNLFKKIPSIHTLYCPINENSWFDQSFSDFCFKTMDYVVAISENVKESLQGFFPNNKIKLIRPIIDTRKFIENTRKKDCQLKKEAFRLLYVGNLKKSKGLLVLLKAMKLLKKEYPTVKLYLALDIPKCKIRSGENSINEIIQSLHLEKNVFPLGIISDLPRLMMNSDLFVCPFNNTHGPADCPVSLLEAMASGLCVVATRVGGIPEIIKDGETGFLVEPNNPQQLAGSIINALTNDQLTRIMSKNAAIFVHNLTDNAVKNYKLLYKHLVINH